jgi:hypothetical protein
MKNITIRNTKSNLLLPVIGLGLTGCGGQTNIKSSPATEAPATVQLTGNVVKGPLLNAKVFADYNNNGLLDADEPFTRTDSDGHFTLTSSESDVSIVATTDGTTTDGSSGAALNGITLTALSGTKVVSLMSTIVAKGDVSADDLASALGLDGIDLMSFNPYAVGANSSNALAVEKVSQQIATTTIAYASAAEGAGVETVAAFTQALDAVSELVESKSITGASVNFTNSSDLNSIKQAMVIRVSEESTADSLIYSAIIDDVTSAVENVNELIASTSDLTSASAKNTFASAQVLQQQILAAATAEAAGTTATIKFKSATEVAASIDNSAPTDITLELSTVHENSSSLRVSRVTVEDDQSSGQFTYSLAGTDADLFEVNAIGDLYLKNAADFEQQASYDLFVIATDEGSKSFSKAITIDVINDDEPTTGDLTLTGSPISGQSLSIQSTLVDGDNGADNANFKSVSYQWYLDGEPLTGQTSATLEMIDYYAKSHTAIYVIAILTDQNGNVSESKSNETFAYTEPSIYSIYAGPRSTINSAEADRVSDWMTHYSMLDKEQDNDNSLDSILNAIQDSSSNSGWQTTVTSEGAQFVSDEYTITADFTNFSPGSLAEVETIISNFDSDNIASFELSGGFNSLTVFNAADTKVLSMDHGINGITFTNHMAAGDVIKSLSLDGSFSNQLGDFISLMDAMQRIVAEAATEPLDANKLLEFDQQFADSYQYTGLSILRGDGTKIAEIANVSEGTAKISFFDHQVTYSLNLPEFTYENILALEQPIDISSLISNQTTAGFSYEWAGDIVASVSVIDGLLAKNMADQGAPIIDTNGNYYSYMDGDVFIANGDGEFLVQLHNSDVPALNDYTIDYAVDLFGDQSPNII